MLNPVLLVVIALSGAVLVWAYYAFIPANMFVRSCADAYAEGRNSTIYMLVQNFLRAIPFCCFMIALLGKAPRSFCASLFLIMLVTLFPGGLPRNATAMFYIPIVCTIFYRFLRWNLFMWIFMASMIFLFPLLNIFREGFAAVFPEGREFMDYMCMIDYDASQVFMATVKTGFVTYGRQLIGALLFFVPRSVWPGKPVGSGHGLVVLNGGEWTNVSMPFFSEGYVNFGFIGLIASVLFMAWLCARLDNSYWSDQRRPLYIGAGYYLILLGAMMYIMRGDLMSSFAFTIAVMAAYALCCLFLRVGGFLVTLHKFVGDKTSPD